MAYQINETTYFKGDPVTVTSEPFELHGGWWQNAQTEDGKVIMIKAPEQREIDTLNNQAAWQNQQAGFRRLKEQAEHDKLLAQLCKETGIDRMQATLTARQWTLWFKDHSDPRIRNIGFALAYGLKTGRLPNRNIDGYLTDTKLHLAMDNLTTLKILISAALAQKENTTRAGIEALMAEFNLRIA